MIIGAPLQVPVHSQQDPQMRCSELAETDERRRLDIPTQHGQSTY